MIPEHIIQYMQRRLIKLKLVDGFFLIADDNNRAVSFPAEFNSHIINGLQQLLDREGTNEPTDN